MGVCVCSLSLPWKQPWTSCCLQCAQANSASYPLRDENLRLSYRQ